MARAKRTVEVFIVKGDGSEVGEEVEYLFLVLLEWLGMQVEELDW